MILPEKYEEIMERITVTEEMRRRVLQNVRSAAAKPAVGAIRLPRWQKYAALAACLAVLLLGALTLPNLLRPAPENPVGASGGDTQPTGAQSITSCKSAADLAAQIGFPVADLTSLPFTPTDTSYLSLFGEIAEIDYTGAAGQTAVYRKSVGTADNSGIYDTFPDTQQLSVGGVSASVKGSGTQFTLAVWTDGTYAYSLVLSEGVGLDEWSAILQGVR